MIHPDIDVLEDYGLGRLAANELEAIEEHLFVCAWCRGRLETVEEYVAPLRIALADLNTAST